MDVNPTAILDVRNLTVSFKVQGGHATAVNRLSFSIPAGRTMALVGESGCGKSTTALSVLRLLPRNANLKGQILFGGQNLATLPLNALRKVRGHEIGMIFQEPMTSLNPVHRIGRQIAEAILYHEKTTAEAARARALELLRLVHLPDPERRLDVYPHQLSGGQRQRVMIAMAIAGNPKLLIADEPTTALDATVQAQILELIDELRRKLGMAILMITHDLGVVSRWADEVVVMHHGENLEHLKAADLFTEGRHPYTRGLIGASIRVSQDIHYRTRPLSEIRVSRDAEGNYEYALELPTRPKLPPIDSLAPPVLEVRNLVTSYDLAGTELRAVDDVSLIIRQGETLGLVGESGCGKSTLSKTIMRLVPATSGQLLFMGRDITRLEGRGLQSLRANMQMIFQDPFGSLNPRHTVGGILDIPLRLHGIADKAERRNRIAEVIEKVGLPAHSVLRYPHEFSGGQRQRIGIARALILRPSLVICDEPVSALDVSVQSQILNLLAQLKEQFQLSYLFISHDLAVVQYISDRVMVMQSGRFVEEGSYRDILRNPRHSYTRTLIAAAEGGRVAEAAA
ncbi:ABC transporter ATP-binding protein [Chelatococcus asaccharovorans]|uniref:Peptide/nickel transport system ATP-binding protein n=1 Tax=Chelatococcus asaccharovorans TaxID=28210 RepID=A0A2V3TTN1_9HYPH|nr:ABC transporter ATP-binding protein [Chelatococcus asaccharovorans]MBS7706143.1 ABC transporter ATP-binding protein [Chelatococcus asaccharovorans]PXW52517.1 peptide/nickel transport system ATP-binding protein [Chelatococcus asaccharovorans]